MREAVLDGRQSAHCSRFQHPLLGKAEQAAPDAGRRPALQEHLVSFPEDKPRRAPQRQRLPRTPGGELVHAAVPLRDALARERTGGATRVAGAHGRAKIHQRLGVGFHVPVRQKALGAPPQVFFGSQVAGQHPPHVPVEDRGALAESEHRDRGGGRAADAGQLSDPAGGAGKSVRANLPRRLVEIAAARVVAQPAPQPQHLVLGSLRKPLDAGESREKALVVGNHGRDLGLLQHDLREPDAVRIARSLPGKPAAAVPPLPGDELLRERHAVTFSQIMLAFILRRLAQAVLVMLTVGLIAFSLFRFVGDPVTFMLGQDATPEQRAEITRLLGLDRPFYVQYLRFLGNAVQGEFGLSLRQVQPVSRLIVERLPATLELSFVAALLALVAGIPMGVYTALKKDSWLAHVMLAVSLAGVSLPTFLIGILLILVFSVQLGWLPSFGRGETVAIGWWTTGLLTASGLKALILPAITLGLFQMTLIQRLVRSEMLEVLRTDYIRFARARGLSDRAVHFGHALKNTLVPVITITGLQLGAIIAFAIITETVFQWPGMGLLFIQAVSVADVPVMAAYLCLIALFFVVINLVVDLLYYAVDPRLRLRPT